MHSITNHIQGKKMNIKIFTKVKILLTFSILVFIQPCFADTGQPTLICEGADPGNTPTFFQVYYGVLDNNGCLNCCRYPEGTPYYCKTIDNPCNYRLDAYNCWPSETIPKAPACIPCRYNPVFTVEEGKTHEDTQPPQLKFDQFRLRVANCDSLCPEVFSSLPNDISDKMQDFCANAYKPNYTAQVDYSTVESNGDCEYTFECTCPDE